MDAHADPRGRHRTLPDPNGAPWSLVSLALGIAGYIEALDSYGRFDELSISAAAGTPDLVAEVRGETLFLATYKVAILMTEASRCEALYVACKSSGTRYWTVQPVPWPTFARG